MKKAPPQSNISRGFRINLSYFNSSYCFPVYFSTWCLQSCLMCSRRVDLAIIPTKINILLDKAKVLHFNYSVDQFFWFPAC